MATLSLDLRERILSAYDKGRGTREEIAERFSVSLGMVKKLLQQRKKLIVAAHRIAIRQHLKRKPDMTLAELREALGLQCTLPAIHYVLVDMGLTYKKRRSAPPNRTAKTSAKRGGAGSAGKAG